ncbi:hypothetical protein [Burkholderia stabilis]|uniref:hypothetical protein n=1 Tax=Burkholderia stabilis TaxID=95485 RepID=UPI001F4BABBF|nr:hypothetical protein [Burkholderia stabilis]
MATTTSRECEPGRRIKIETPYSSVGAHRRRSADDWRDRMSETFSPAMAAGESRIFGDVRVDVDCLDEHDRHALQGILAKIWQHLKRQRA